MDFFDKECMSDLQNLIKVLFEDPEELKSVMNRTYVKYYSEKQVRSYKGLSFI